MRLGAIVLTLVAAGCSGGSANAPSQGGLTCPMDVPDTTVGVHEIAAGVGQVFPPGEDGVEDLRRSVRRTATDEPPLELPPARARVEDLPGGARLLLTPLDPVRVEELRLEASRWAETMA